MAEMKLACDMTDVCRRYLIDRPDSEIQSGHSNKCISFENDHYYNVHFESLKEGDILAADIIESPKKWEYIRIDHIYRDVAFYTILGDVKKNENMFQKGSAFFSIMIFPCYIIKDKSCDIVCSCPLTKIVDSEEEIDDGHRTYEFEIREEQDFI